MKNFLFFLLVSLLLPAASYGQIPTLKPAEDKDLKANENTEKKKPKTKGNLLSQGFKFAKPKNVDNADLNSGFEELQSDNAEGAYAVFDQYAEDDADAAYGLGLYFVGEGQYEEAKAKFQKAIELDPGHTEAYSFLGLLYSIDEEYEIAEGYLLEAIRLNPNDTDAWYELGAIYFEVGLYKDAVDCFLNVVDIHQYFLPEEDDVEAWDEEAYMRQEELGEIYFELARLSVILMPAEEEFKTALNFLSAALERGVDKQWVYEDPDLEVLGGYQPFEELMRNY